MLKKSFTILIFLFLSSQIFSAAMNPRVRQVPKQIQDEIFVNPKDSIVPLVKFLVGSSNDVSAKVRIMHDWICDNIAYDCDVFTEEGAGPQGYETVLKKRKAVCIGYSNLLSVMCQIANIECEIVSGWSKGFNYPGYLREESDHAWNVVKIGGKWKLLDVTLDAGFVERRYFIKHYTLQYYNLSPAQFIYSHLPEEEKWQLLSEKQIRSKEDFVKEPYVPGIFFEYGLSLGKNAPDYTNEISEATGFDIVASKNNTVIMASLYEEESGEKVEHGNWFENAGSNRRFIFDVPDKSLYSARFAARINGVTSNPTHFSRSDFERQLLPKIQSLLSAKKITAKEAELFEKSYYLIEENSRYYFDEDLFDNPRNQANNKILKLLDRNTNRYENVLSVDIKADSDYEGFGKNVSRFPQMYQGYHSVQTISLASPLKGCLKRGSEEFFSLKTNAYSQAAIILNGKDFVKLPKNPKNGAFELSYAIPENIESLDVYASKDGKEYISIFSYSLE